MNRNYISKVAKYLTDKDTYTTTLVCIFIDVYGIEKLNSWAPETIIAELEDDFDVDIPEYNIDKLMTGLDILKTNRFFFSLPDFMRACCVMTGYANNKILILPEVEDIAWGLTEALFLNPPEENENAFSEEIKAYIAWCLRQEGLLTIPNVLKVAISDYKDLLTQAKHEFSDDPIFYQSIVQFEASKEDIINQFVMDNIKKLLLQLKDIPFQNANQKFLEKSVTKIIEEINKVDKTPQTNISSGEEEK